MIHYRISFSHPHRKFIDLEATFPNPEKGQMKLQLPAWRPGRYELGNFARNIRKWQAYDQDGHELKFRKLSKDLWEVDAEGTSEVRVHYDYYANVLNAGSTWVDKGQLYVNPVNCFFYQPESQDTPYTVHLDLPGDWKVACGMEKSDGQTLFAKDVQQLMDCPFIASPDIAHLEYNVEDVRFHIWIQGAVVFDIERFVNDHKSFTEYQMKVFGDIPCEEYHFLYQFPPFDSRHGVEHSNSTVMTYGPAEKLSNESDYLELLGISCHELYHTWNVKNIRPVEMMPYDFSTENYSRLGFVAEGVTTYFGDHFLLRCGVFDLAEYLRRLGLEIERHINNPGRLNLSVAESSFDTWLDGYVSGIPGRKVSIYNEGCLAAIIADIHILEKSSGKYSLDDVMTHLYEEFGKKEKGYSESDYRSAVQHFSGEDMPWLFDGLIYNNADYLEHIESVLAAIGLNVRRHENADPMRARFGMLINGSNKVIGFAEGSPTDEAELQVGDQVISIDGKENIAEVRLKAGTSHVMTIDRYGSRSDVGIVSSTGTFYDKVTVQQDPKTSEKASSLFTHWLRS